MIQFFVFCFALWFGAYLIQHNPRKPTLCWTGLGLIAYAAALAVDTLAGSDSPLRWIPVALTILCWVAAVISIFRPAVAETARSLSALIIVLTLFFGLGIALLILPFEIFPGDLSMLAISVDMVLLGYAVIRLDAFEEGQHFLPAAVQSLAGSILVIALVGGQITLIGIIASRNEPSPALRILLYTLTGTAVLLQTFAHVVDSLLDHLAFAGSPTVQAERADLRAAEQSLPLRGDSENLAAMSDETFTRLTRRALSAYGDLRRLAGSPLIDLPVIHERIRLRGASDNTLERAAELKTLLTESIARLKPRDGSGFGTSDEWRYYNALHFIYVIGLRPYSARADHNELSADERAALQWFQSVVPERTLHNWQNAAARLIADDLRQITPASLAAP